MRFARWVATVLVVAWFPAAGMAQESPPAADGLIMMVMTTWQCAPPADFETVMRSGGFKRIMTGTGDDGRRRSIFVLSASGRWFMAARVGELVCVIEAGSDPGVTIGDPA